MDFIRNSKTGNEKGFTLVEAIVSILLVGILAAVAGMGLVSMVQGYVFTRENVVITQKAQLALGRISRELMAISDIDLVKSTGTCIVYKMETESQYYRAIGSSSGNLELKVSSVSDCDCDTTGYTLVDNAGSFGLQYEDQDGNLLPNPPADITNLYAIHVSLTLTRSDGENAGSFKITINPRNNGNLNGPGI